MARSQKGLKVHIDEYEAQTPDDLALLFRQFDDRKSGRSAGDVAGAYQGLHEPLRAVPKAAAKLGIDGVSWYRRTIEGVPVPSGDGVYSLMNETGLHSFLRWLGDIFSIKTPELRRAQIVSAMYATYIANEAAARTFWDQVARGGVEYEDNHPTTVLDNWLKAIKEDGADLKKNLKPASYYQGSIFAWNAHREDKTIKDHQTRREERIGARRRLTRKAGNPARLEGGPPRRRERRGGPEHHQDLKGTQAMLRKYIRQSRRLHP